MSAPSSLSRSQASAVCSDCPAVLGHNPRRKGTRCKPCTARHIARSQNHRSAVSRAMTRRWTDPHEARRLRQAISKGIGPEERERRRQRGTICCNCRTAAAGSEARARAGRSLSQTKLGWLPLEYRGDYLNLRRNLKYRAADARRVIEEQIARDLSRYRATGQLQRSEVSR